MREPRRRRPAPRSTVTLRRGTVRIPPDIAVRVRAGHPWVFRDALAAAWQPRGIYEQLRLKPRSGEATRGPATLARGELAPVEVAVREDDAHFLVDVTAPHNVGLFPDLRAGRRAVRALARGRRVLN